MLGRAFDWFCRNRTTGEITIGQWPNLSITLFGIAYAIEALWRPDGGAGLILWIITRLFLAWWATDELLRGVNPWRRTLGGLVLGYLGVVALRKFG